MKPEIRKIRIDELEKFVQSDIFSKFTTLPISSVRAKSYLANPNAKPENIALYLAFTESKLIAFRSVFAGSLLNKNKSVRFGWCSGAWVHPEFRRKGLSQQLLNEALADWDGKLILTNYSPQTENLFLKNGNFQSIYQFSGIRAYLFPKTQKLISFANKNAFSKFAFSILDLFISLISNIRLLFFHQKLNSKITFSTLKFPDEECYKFIQINKKPLFFNRDEKELNWIFRFPWVTGEKSQEFKKYPFTVWSNSFTYQTIKVYYENQFYGFFIFSVREGHLKTLYFNFRDGIEEEIANYLKHFCKKHKIEVITVYNNEIALQLIKRKFPFLHAKKYGQKIYSSFHVEIDENQKIQDGDGDVIFT